MRVGAAGAAGEGADGEGAAIETGTYLRSLASTCAEVPGLLVCTWLVHRIGRLRTAAAAIATASLALAVAASTLLPAGGGGEAAAVGRLVVVAVGRSAAFGAYSALYVLTAESFPTSSRATAFGVVTACARLAGAATPFVAGTVWGGSPAAAVFVYAAAAALCALVLTLTLRETGRAPMPDELAELVG